MKKQLRLLVENLFDDLYDIDQEINSDVDLADQIYNTIPYNTKLKPIIYKLLNIGKPRGFKFEKSKNDEYEKFYFIADFFQNSVYVREIENLLKANNWKTFYIKSSDEYLKYKSIENFLDKYNKDKNEVHTIMLSPDESLIYAYIQVNPKGPYYERHKYYILTFTGLLTENIIYNKKESRDTIKQAKLKETRIKKFKKFLSNYNGLSYFKSYATKYENDGYPYLFLTIDTFTHLYKIYSNFVKVRSMYRSIEPSQPNVLYETISVNNPYVHVYFVEDKNHEYSNDKYVILIKLTDDGKQQFDMECK